MVGLFLFASVILCYSMLFLSQIGPADCVDDHMKNLNLQLWLHEGFGYTRDRGHT